MTAISNAQSRLNKMAERQAHDAKAVEEVKRNQVANTTFAKPVTTEDVLKNRK